LESQEIKVNVVILFTVIEALLVALVVMVETVFLGSKEKKEMKGTIFSIIKKFDLIYFKKNISTSSVLLVLLGLK
jgi:hypothetical protein